MKDSEVLAGAMEALRARGMRKFYLGSFRGPVCALGAINIALHGDPSYAMDSARAMEFVGPLGRIAAELFPDRVTQRFTQEENNIVPFNNHDDTTLDDLIVVFEKAYIRALESE